MTTYLIVGLAGGLIFALLDFVLNVNPLAQRLNAPYRPIARTRMPLVAAIVIDLLSGLAMAGIFLLLRPALPGGPVLWRGHILRPGRVVLPGSHECPFPMGDVRTPLRDSPLLHGGRFPRNGSHRSVLRFSLQLLSMILRCHPGPDRTHDGQCAA